MKALFFASATLAAAIPMAAQVQAPSTPARVPSAPVTTPAVVPGFPVPARPSINPAVPRATPPSAVGRTFNTVPAQGGFPPPRPIGNPFGEPLELGLPPLVAPGTSALTNAGLAPFNTNVVGFGGTRVGTGFAPPLTNIAPPIALPFTDPIAVDLPPGTVIRGVPIVRAPRGTVSGGPLPPPSERFPNPTGTGAAPANERGTSASAPNVVRPPR